MNSKLLEKIANAEAIDEFLERGEDCQGEVIEYCTTHGSRWLSKERPERNLFLVLTKGDGFARAVALPYVRTYNSKLGIPQLVVEYSHQDAPATIAGYAQAVPLSESSDGSEIYIEDLGILDTEYAAMLESSPRIKHFSPTE